MQRGELIGNSNGRNKNTHCFYYPKREKNERTTRNSKAELESEISVGPMKREGNECGVGRRVDKPTTSEKGKSTGKRNVFRNFCANKTGQKIERKSDRRQKQKEGGEEGALCMAR